MIGCSYDCPIRPCKLLAMWLICFQLLCDYEDGLSYFFMIHDKICITNGCANSI